MITLESLTIRPLTQISEFTQAIEVQQLTWSRSDYSLIPPTIFKSFTKNGGCVMGAFEQTDDGSEKVVGYVIGFLSITSDGSLYHHSQQVAVLPEYQQLGIAFQLKQAQKDYVKNTFNIGIMTWTVDPLLSKNAFLNFHKLGAIGRLYWDNYYGSREDTLNSGLETDRIEVEWYFTEPQQTAVSKVRQAVPDDFPCLNYSDSGIYGHNKIGSDPYIGVCIPRDLVNLKKNDLQLAVSLRKNFRSLAHQLISNNYTIIDVKSKVEPKTILIWTNKFQDFKKLKE